MYKRVYLHAIKRDKRRLIKRTFLLYIHSAQPQEHSLEATEETATSSGIAVQNW